jgi:hypothetical protein
MWQVKINSSTSVDSIHHDIRPRKMWSQAMHTLHAVLAPIICKFILRVDCILINNIKYNINKLKMDSHVPTQSSLKPAPLSDPTMSNSQPGWGFVFGLILIIIFIGFLLIYIVFRTKKQEKQIELLMQRTQQLPSLQDDIVKLVDDCNQNSHNASMRNVYGMVNTRLNDFDKYCRSNFVLRQQQPISSDQLKEPPPLEETTCPSVVSPLASEGMHDSAPPSSAPPSSVPSSSAPSSSSAPPSGRSNSISITQQSAPERPTSLLNDSTLTGGLPSLFTNLLSNINGLSNSNNNDTGGVSLPMMIGEIMTVYSNQQARQARMADENIQNNPSE